MKKYFSICAVLMMLATSTFGQSTRSGNLSAMTANGTLKSTPDTTVNVDTTYLYASRSDANQWDVTYEWSIVPSITGTTTGTIIVQGSNTGTYAVVGDWVTLISDVTQYNGSSSISVTGSTTIGYFIFPRCQFKYVRIRYISAGTQTSVLTGTYVFSSRFSKTLD